jgi:putative endonuclease
MVNRLVSVIQKHTTLGPGTKAKAHQKTDKRKRGDVAEDLALAYFQQRAFELIARNFNCRLGELDLVMSDQDYLVFIEVRHRKSHLYGGALESITPSKQAKLRRAAEVYMQSTKTPDCPCRFDILCLTGNLNKPDYQWIKNAF